MLSLAAFLLLGVVGIVPFFFYAMVLMAFLFRKGLVCRGLNGDGQAFWELFKKWLASLDGVRACWCKRALFGKFASLGRPLPSDASPEEKAEWEVDHFLFQLYNLQNEEPTLRKLLQVALNLGQFVGTVPVAEWRQHRFEWKMLWIGMYMSLASILRLALRLTVGW